MWYYRHGIGPSRWVKVAVHDEGDEGRTILNARRHLERDGRITVSLPELEVEASDLEGVLTPA